MANWVCKHCHLSNLKNLDICRSCGFLKLGFKVGDWLCRTPNCEAHNFAGRKACYKCGTTINDDNSGSSIVQQACFERSENTASWVCRQCQRSNFRYLDICRRCGCLKREFKVGDWFCPNCEAHNSADTVTCYKCGATNGGSSIVQEDCFEG